MIARTKHRTAFASFLALAVSAALGCSSNEDDGPSEGAGGSGGSAGALSSGGSGGSGGTATTGGTAGTTSGGTSSATGGTGGSGAAVGGAGGASGASSNGGSGGGGGASAGTSGAGGTGGIVACDPSMETEDPTPVNVPNQGAPFTGSHEVAVETDPGLPGYTIFRPSDLGSGTKYPIVAWGQGGCSQNGTTAAEFLSEIASHGYLIIADGVPNGTGSREQSGNYRQMGEPLVAALDWAIAENDRPCSQYYRNLEPAKTAVMGFSCGGLMAEGASNDPRLTTVMLWSSGMINPDPSVIEGIHTPIAIILGGEEDIAYENGMRDYEDIESVPALVANTPVGHGGTYAQDNGGAFGRVGVAWLGWWLQGDLGATGKGMFVGASCGLCTDDAWTVESKNLD